MECLRSDDELFIKFGQLYMTTTLPGVVKGWHLHHVQYDNIVCVKGMIKLVLYDGRDGFAHPGPHPTSSSWASTTPCSRGCRPRCSTAGSA